VATLRAAHGADPKGSRMGVDVVEGAAGDMAQLGIYESFKVKNQVGVVCGCAGWRV
jgi:T-complex protein 1 subunit beta